MVPPRDGGGYYDALLHVVVYLDFPPFSFGFLTEAEFFFSLGTDVSAFLFAFVEAVVLV